MVQRTPFHIMKFVVTSDNMCDTCNEQGELLEEQLMAVIFRFVSAFRTVFRPFAGASRVNSGAGPYGEGNPSGWYH